MNPATSPSVQPDTSDTPIENAMEPTTRPPSMPRHAASWSALAWRRRWRSFLTSNSAGGMAIALTFVVAFLGTVGAAMSNYAWREAQWEELRTSERAAIAAVGDLLGATANDPAAMAKLMEYLEAMQPGFVSSPATVTRGADDVITVTIRGTFTVDDVWGTSDSTTWENQVRVKLEHERYEVAMALDISGSMLDNIPGRNGDVQKITALKSAMAVAVRALRRSARRTPGSLMTSVVPFMSLVNVADTATAGETVAKHRYVRMLAGAMDNGRTLPMAEVLAGAEEDAKRGLGQWVDTFHGYGVGADMGVLRSLGLPDDLLQGRDWNLRRTGVVLPVGDQFARANSTDREWTVDDVDFWNGCLMARWGAYWNPDHRPAGFAANPLEPAYWPAKTDVKGWSPAADTLDDVPLHLSDHPPDRANPHTLFTAYSWPDASISVPDEDTGPDKDAGSADHWLQVMMVRLLDARGAQAVGLATGQDLIGQERVGLNHWNRAGGGGDGMCMTAPLVPLTDDLATVQAIISNLSVPGQPLSTPVYSPTIGHATYLVRGFVWALRTVSPLWEPVWDVADVAGRPRPGTPCAQGETTDCDPLVRKSILLVTDGANFPGKLGTRRLTPQASDHQTPHWPSQCSGVFCDDNVCEHPGIGQLPDYHDAWGLMLPSSFNSHFDAAQNGVSANPLPSRRFAVADPAAFTRLDQAWRWDGSVPRGFPGAQLGQFTPWDLFRGPTPPTGSNEVATDMLMASSGIKGRPMLLTGYCGPVTPPGPYGSIDDHVLVDERGAKVLPPVRNVAPFTLPQTQRSPFLPDDGSTYAQIERDMTATLDTWFLDACTIAGKRGVRVYAIYIGNRSSTDHIRLLERCIDAAGGDPNADEVYVTPDERDLRRSFRDIFIVRRNLRFVI